MVIYTYMLIYWWKKNKWSIRTETLLEEEFMEHPTRIFGSSPLTAVLGLYFCLLLSELDCRWKESKVDNSHNYFFFFPVLYGLSFSYNKASFFFLSFFFVAQTESTLVLFIFNFNTSSMECQISCFKSCANIKVIGNEISIRVGSV